jgi:hypothetical protein
MWTNGELELIAKSTNTYAKAHGAGSTSSRGHTSRKEHIHGNLLVVQETGHGRPVKYMAFTEAAWEALWLRQLHQASGVERHQCGGNTSVARPGSGEATRGIGRR